MIAPPVAREEAVFRRKHPPDVFFAVPLRAVSCQHVRRKKGEFFFHGIFGIVATELIGRFDNYASQVGKGTHYGLDRLQEFMRRFYRKNGIDGWILKGDISKYFYSIRHDVLKTLIREKITDPDVLWLIDLIIDSTEGNVGIPIGNQTSQLFALLYLDGLDHFVKEKLGNGCRRSRRTALHRKRQGRREESIRC